MYATSSPTNVEKLHIEKKNNKSQNFIPMIVTDKQTHVFQNVPEGLNVSPRVLHFKIGNPTFFMVENFL